MSGGAFDHLKSTYFQECGELLDNVYGHLTALEQGNADEDTVHAIFRAIHSIKGGGGAFGFSRMVAFAHVLETLLDLLRDGKLALDAPMASLLLRAVDALSDLVAAERSGEPAASGFEDKLLAELTQAVTPGATPAAAAHVAAAPSAAAGTGLYVIQLQPRPELFKNASEPLLLIRALQRLGTMEVQADLSRLPSLDRLDPEAAYIGWTIILRTEAPRAEIEEIFEFVADHCDLDIQAKTAGAAEPEPCATERAAAQLPGPAVAAPPAAPQPQPAQPSQQAVQGAPPSVRVDVEKIDRLVNLVGELVINQAMLVQLGASLPPDMCPGLFNGLATLSQHLRELQDGVMAIRTQPVKSVFARMPRLVRELSAQLGKQVRLVVTGEGTEIDKTVIEQLGRPVDPSAAQCRRSRHRAARGAASAGQAGAGQHPSGGRAPLRAHRHRGHRRWRGHRPGARAGQGAHAWPDRRRRAAER